MFRDLRSGMRVYARHPASTAAIVLVLAFGLGAVTAVFSLLNEWLLRGTPGVSEPERVVLLERRTESGTAGFTHVGFMEYRRLARSFSGMAAERGAPLLLSEGGETSRVAGVLVTEGYFRLLGVGMTLGRDFLPEEQGGPDAAPAAILSHAFWAGRLRGDRSVVGGDIRLNGTRFTVVGVAAPGFGGIEPGTRVDVWLPLGMEERARPLFPVLNADFFTILRTVARLAPGVDVAQAREEMRALAARIERPVGSTGTTPRVVLAERLGVAAPEWRHMVVSASLPLAAAAGLLLAIILVNVSGVLLVRSLPRRKEMALRLAFGARRARLVRQVLTETLVLALPAGGAGLLVALAVHTHVAGRFAYATDLAPDHRVVLFAAVAAVLSCGLAALVPALDLSGRNLDRELRDQGSASRLSPRPRVFVTGQIAISLALLTVAGLLLRSFRAEAGEDLGFETGRLYQAELDLRLAGFTVDEARNLHGRLAREVSGIPGVRSVSVAAAAPVDRGFVWNAWPVRPDGAAEPFRAQRNAVGPGYFEVLGVGLVAGRGFTDEDVEGAARVAVVNEALAARLRPGPVLGRVLRFPGLLGPGEPLEVVGVTRDVRVVSRDDAIHPEVLLPLAQTDDAGAVLLFRPYGDPEAVVTAVREAVRRIVPALPPPAIESVRERRDRMLAGERLYAEVAALFGLVGLLVAGVGLYGTVSFDVARRQQALSVRISLGADRGEVRAMVIRDALRTAGGGVAIGLVCGLLAARALRGVLHGVAPTDPVAFGVATGVVLVVVVFTAWLSSRSAVRLDPVALLRAH